VAVSARTDASHAERRGVHVNIWNHSIEIIAVLQRNLVSLSRQSTSCHDVACVCHSVRPFVCEYVCVQMYIHISKAVVQHLYSLLPLLGLSRDCGVL